MANAIFLQYTAPIYIAIVGRWFVAIAGVPFLIHVPLGHGNLWRLLLLGVVQLGVPYVFYAAAIKHVTALEATLIPLLEPS